MIALIFTPAPAAGADLKPGDPCIFCGSRGQKCPRSCASYDPPQGRKPCPLCGVERYLFRCRLTGVVACWVCRGEPDPGELEGGEEAS